MSPKYGRKNSVALATKQDAYLRNIGVNSGDSEAAKARLPQDHQECHQSQRLEGSRQRGTPAAYQEPGNLATMALNSVRMILKWSVPQGESRHIVSALQGLMLTTRAEPGCVGCSLSTDVHKHGKVEINYLEEWNSEEDLTRRLRSDKFTVLAELMEHASEFPTMEFTLPGATRGADYAEEIRGSETL